MARIRLVGVAVLELGSGGVLLAFVVLNSQRDMGLPLLSRQVKRRDRVVAIDLGGRTTKAVHVQRRGDRFSLIDFAIIDSPVAGSGNPAQEMESHLRRVSEEITLPRNRNVMLVLGVSETLFRQVEVPLMPVPDLRLMLKLNSKTYLQQELPDHVFDCNYVLPRSPVGEQPKAGVANKRRALVGGAKRKVVEDLATAARAAGLLPEQLVPGVIGPSNAFEMAQPEVFNKEVVALVDIGFNNSTITLLDAGEIILNRVVGLGGDGVTRGLMEGLGVGYGEAENIKQGMASEVQSTLEAVINPLGRELRASIDFFEHQHDKTVTQVLVSGGSARNDLIMEILQAELMLPCKSWTPLAAMEMSLSPQKMGQIEQVASQLTVAVGAAMSVF